MADYNEYGDMGWGYDAPADTYSGYWDPNSYQGYQTLDSMNLDSWDPASPYYTGGSQSSGGGGSWQDYMPGGSQYIPPGGGYFQTGDQQPQQIYAPSSGYSNGYSPAQGMSTPAMYSSGYTGPTQYAPTTDPFANWNPQHAQMSAASSAQGIRPSGGGSGYTGQPPQRANLGTPERTLYDRYSSLLTNPASMAGDPAYQFLYNQGLQTMNRSLAAKGLLSSGKSLNDSMAYGQGMAYDYMNKMLPQFQAGAQEELRRFMGPAGLQPTYTNLNNNVTQAQGAASASRDLVPYYQQMLSQSAGGGAQPNIGYGGQSSSYTPQPRLQQAWTPQYTPQPSPVNWGDSWGDFMDQAIA